MRTRATTRNGFTLIETMAVVAITTFLVAALLNIYVGIMNNSERAIGATRELRVAAAVLDRVARDLQGAYVLVREEADDPLEHPWLFKADTRAGQLGADRVMFTTLSHASRSRTSDGASSTGPATYAYWLEGDDESGYDLLRWVTPRLAPDQGFPSEQQTDALVVAENLASFSLHFLDDFGEWSEAWDSTALVDSGELPLVVEIRLSLPPSLDPEEIELREQFGETIEPREYRRKVVLYQRPLTRGAALGLGSQAFGGGEEEDSLFEDASNGCKVMTFAQCYARQPKELLDSLTPDERALHDSWANKCVPANVNLVSTKLDMNRCRG